MSDYDSRWEEGRDADIEAMARADGLDSMEVEEARLEASLVRVNPRRAALLRAFERHEEEARLESEGMDCYGSVDTGYGMGC